MMTCSREVQVICLKMRKQLSPFKRSELQFQTGGGSYMIRFIDGLVEHVFFLQRVGPTSYTWSYSSP